MDKSVDKSVAIAKILEKENLLFENAIAFGDGYNDEKMLNSTFKGLLMGNAPDSLKSKLSHLEIIETNNNEGVANYLSKIILNL
jgi:hydroxymethylpyrimidine pyrophosphatase-like HAD family hydrolase